MNKAKEGDKFIKPDSNKIYVVKKLVFKGNWVVLQEEDGKHQILTSQASLKTWIRDKNQQE